MTTRTRGLREATAPRRGLSRLEAAVYVGIGIDKFDDLVKRGRMPVPRLVDAAQVWDQRELDIYFDALPKSEGAQPRGNYLDDQ
jgi:hypothetical protein